MFIPFDSAIYGYGGLHIREFYGVIDDPISDIWLNYKVNLINRVESTYFSYVACQAMDITDGAMVYYTGKNSGIPYNLESKIIDRNNNFKDFGLMNIHLYDNKCDIYCNEVYRLSKTFSNYFGVMGWFSARSYQLKSDTHSSIEWIAVTDKMVSDVPKPPYTLDKKENNMYGIQKQSE